MRFERPSTIREAGVDSEQFLIVHIGESKSNKTVSNDTIRTKDSELWFFQVADVSELIWAPFRLRDSSGTLNGAISSGSGVNYNQFYDSSGDEILRNDDEPWRVYHFSVGCKQNDIRIYPRIPENQNGGGWAYLTGSEPDPTAGDEYGYVPASNTDYDDPGVELETVAWETGNFTEHQYGFYNEGDSDIDPILSIRGYAYELRPVTERDAKLQMLADAGRYRGDQQQATAVVDYSRSALRTFSYDVPEEWKDAENTLTISSANLPEEIEQVLETEGIDAPEPGDG